MVHYHPKPNDLAQGPTPRCPKCGSHRTEIIGMSIDLRTTYLRCSTCGARSELPARDAREAVIAG